MHKKLLLGFALVFMLAGQLSAQCLYQLDNGTVGGGIGPNPDWSYISLNHFTVTGGASTIVGVEACWLDIGGPDHVITAAVWSDPNQDGDPSDGILLGTSVPTLSDYASGCNVFDLQAPVNVGVDGTHFFVGVSWMDEPVGVMLVSTDSSPSLGRSWRKHSPDAPDLSDLSGVAPRSVNMLIRGICDGQTSTESSTWGSVKSLFR